MTQEKMIMLMCKDAQDIKALHEATGILRPNIRRIVGQGAKAGKFERIEKGVYILTDKGKDILYLHTGDACEILPRLADDGLKVDMIFLDIPYNTPAVRGGNRGIKYDCLTPEQFKSIVQAMKRIIRTDKSPVFYMYSQAPSGMKAMSKYNNIILDEFKIVKRGSLTKYQKDGTTRCRNMRGNTIPPEVLLLLSRTGDVIKGSEATIDFGCVRPKGYQTEKPAEMLRAIIQATTETGDTVLDPFTGSGVTLDEAIKLGRVAVGVELKQSAVEDYIKPRLTATLERI